MGTRVRGEASVVEIAPGRYLFALLDGNKEAELAMVLFFPDPAPRTFERARQLETLRGVREVSRDRYPLLVTFDDLNDPTTVRRVDPADLAATFGPGVTLRRITLEITDKKMTKGRVVNLLQWLASWPKIDPAINEGRTETLRYPNESPRGYAHPFHPCIHPMNRCLLRKY